MKKGVTKHEFIAKFEELLAMTREGVVALRLDETSHGSYVIVKFKNGHCITADITADSGLAIIRDVAAQIN